MTDSLLLPPCINTSQKDALLSHGINYPLISATFREAVLLTTKITTKTKLLTSAGDKTIE